MREALGCVAPELPVIILPHPVSLSTINGDVVSMRIFCTVYLMGLKEIHIVGEAYRQPYSC